MKKGLRTLLAVFLCLYCVSASWGARPEDALRARPARSVYMVLSLQDLGGFLRQAISPATLKVLAPAIDLDEDSINRLTASLEKVPARNAALLSGTTDPKAGPFLQIALAFPPELQPKLDLVASGKATAADLAELLLGTDSPAAAMAPALFNKIEPVGDGILKVADTLLLGAKDDLLLLALSEEEIQSGLAALEDNDRLQIQRRFDAKDFAMLHMDPDVLDALLKAAAEDDDDDEGSWSEEDSKQLKEALRAPLDVEFGFEKPAADKFLLSSGLNLKDALSEKYLNKLTTAEPVPGGHIILTGEENPLMAFGTCFNADGLEDHPLLRGIWAMGLETLKGLGIEEADVKGLMSGYMSFAVGGSVPFTFMNIKANFPGVCIIKTGSNGAAASIFKKLEAMEELPLNPVKVSGWEQMLQADPAISPVPGVLGLQGEMLLLGVRAPASIAGKPAPEGELAALMQKESVGSMFVNLEGLRSFLADEKNNIAGVISIFDGEAADTFKDALDIQLSVPCFTGWASSMETFFMEFGLADIQPEKGLLARIVQLYLATKSRTPWERLSGVPQRVTELASKQGSGEQLLSALKTELGNDVSVLQQGNTLYVGTLVDDGSQQDLITKAKTDGAVRGSAGLEMLPGDEPYAGQEAVWLVIELPSK